MAQTAASDQVSNRMSPKQVSRFLLVIVGPGIALSSPLNAQGNPAEDVMARYRALTSVAPKPCQSATEHDEIVVCADTKLRESQKVPYIEELRVGERPRLSLGELPGNDPGPQCPPRGCPCPPSECGLRAILHKLSGK